jgi:ketosteroid isomerase-like protein
LTDLIAEDATFWFSDGTHRGIAAIRGAFEATWHALADETYWLDQLEWIAEGDIAAACTYRFNWKATIDGQPSSGSGRGTTVLKRVDDRWWIVHEHLSPPRS